MSLERFFDDLIKEHDEQHRKHGYLDNIDSPLDLLSILVEEVGEVAKECQDWRWGRVEDKDKFIKDISKELVQVAAVSMAFYDYINKMKDVT